MTKTEQDLVAKYEEIYATLPAKISGVKFGEEMIFGGRLEKAYRSASALFNVVQKICIQVNAGIDTTPTEVDPSVLLTKVAQKFQITENQIRFGGRKREFSNARAVFSTLLLINSEYDLDDIGAFYSDRGLGTPCFNHSTIIYHRQKYIRLLDKKGKESQAIIEIVQELNLTNYNAVRLYSKTFKKKKAA